MSATEQRAAALAVANDRRLRRAALKRQCRAGTVDVMSLIASGLFDNMYLVDVLQLPVRKGPAAVAHIMNRLAMSPTVKTGHLTERQTALLSRYLRAANTRERDVVAWEARLPLALARQDAA